MTQKIAFKPPSLNINVTKPTISFNEYIEQNTVIPNKEEMSENNSESIQESEHSTAKHDTEDEKSEHTLCEIKY